MAVRASDLLTLAVLPSPSYVRQFFLKQASALSPPAKPTTNPPAAPWSTTEPTYTPESTDTLYTVMLTAYGSVAFEYGEVQKSSSFEAAKQAYNRAESAANAVDILPKVFHGTTAAVGSAPDGSTWEQHKGPGLATPVIARWTRVSGAWQSTPIDGLAVSNMDIGYLTSGGASMAEVVSQKIFTDIFAANKITAKNMVVASGNLFPDPNFELSYSGWTKVSGGIERTGTGAQGGAYSADTRFEVKKDDELSFEVNRAHVSGTLTGLVGIYAQIFDASGTQLATAIKVYDIPASEGLHQFSYKVTTADAAYMQLGFFTQGSVPSGTRVRLSGMRIIRKASTVTIADGAITAEKITVTDTLTAKIVSGQYGIFDHMIASKTAWLNNLTATGITSIDNLTVTGAAKLNTAVANQIFTDIFAANKITAKEIVVSSGNLVDNPVLADVVGGLPAGWSRRSGAASASVVTTTTGLPGASWNLKGVSTEVSVQTGRVPVLPGTKYRIDVKAQVSLTGSTPMAYARLHWFDRDGVYISQNGIAMAPSGWKDYSEVVESPANAFYAEPTFIHGNNSTGGQWWFGNPVITEMVSGVKISNGAVSADKMAANSVTASTIVSSEDMWTKVLGAHKISVGELDANSITSDTAFMGSIWAAGITVATGVPVANIDTDLIQGKIDGMSATDAITQKSGKIWRQSEVPPIGRYYRWEGLPDNSTSTYREEDGRVLDTNLYASPSLQAVGDTTKQFGGVSWAGSSGNVRALSMVPATWARSGKAWQVKWTATGTPDSGDLGFYIRDTVSKVGFDKKITVQYRLKVNQDSVLGAENLYTAAGTSSHATIHAIGSSGQTPVKSGQAVDRWITFTAKSTVGTDFRILQTPYGKSVGDSFEISDVFAYEGDFNVDERGFSGDTAGDRTNDMWMDTANGNTSKVLTKKSALALNSGGGNSSGTRFGADGWAVTVASGTPTLSEVLKYDALLIDAGYGQIPAASRALAASAFAAGINVYSTGNDTPDMAPLFTGTGDRGVDKSQPITASGTHPIATHGWPAFTETDNTKFLMGIHANAVVVATSSVSGTAQPMVVALEDPRTGARWVHSQPYGVSANTGLTEAVSRWLSNHWRAVPDETLTKVIKDVDASKGQSLNVIPDPNVRTDQWKGFNPITVHTTGGRTAGMIEVPAGSSTFAFPLTRTVPPTNVSSTDGAIIPVEPGQVWEVSAWYKTTSDYALHAANYSGLRIGTSNNSFLIRPAGETTVSTDWKKMTGRYVVPAGMSGLQLWIFQSHNVGTIWWTDFSMRDVSVPVDALTSGTLTSGTKIDTQAGTAKVTIDTSGIKAYNASGQNTVAINSDGSATFTGTITATSNVAAGAISGALATTNIPQLAQSKITGLGTVATNASNAVADTTRWKTTGKTTIDGGQITADSITATQIAANTITAVQIATGTITANQLALGDMTNLAPGGGFDTDVDLSNWINVVSTHGYSIDTTNTASGSGGSLRVAAHATTTRYIGLRFPALPGDKLRFSWKAKTSADYNGTAGWGKLRVADQAGGAINSPGWTASTVFKEAESIVTVPDGASGLYVQLCFNHTAGTIWLDDFEIRRMTGGKLIVDGEITALKIGADAVTADHLHADSITSFLLQGDKIKTHASAGRGVEIDNNGIRAYSATTNDETFKITSADGKLTAKGGVLTEGSVTGAVIQTESTDNRGIKIDSVNGLRAFTNTGAKTVEIKPNGDASFTGTINVGSTIPASTVSGALAVGNIPALDQSKVTNLTSDLSNINKSIDAKANLVNNPTLSGTIDRWTVNAGGLAALTIQNKDMGFGTMPVLHHERIGNTFVYSDYFDVDPARAYEVRLTWAKPVMNSGAETDFYFGLTARSKGTSVGVTGVNPTTGAVTGTNPDTNFYWFTTKTPEPVGKSIVAYILPVGTNPSVAKGLGANADKHAIFSDPTTNTVQLRWLNYGNLTEVLPAWVGNVQVIETTVEAITRANEAQATATAVQTLTDGWKSSGKTTIDGGKITADSITATQIAAQSITSKQIAISDLTNLTYNIQDAVERGSVSVGTSWSFTQPASPADPTLPWSLTVTNPIGWASSHLSERTVAVTPGEKLRVSMYARASGGIAGSIRLGMAAYRQDGTTLISDVTGGAVLTPAQATSWTPVTDVQTIPAGAAFVRVYVKYITGTAGTGTWETTGHTVRRMAGGELIVDGAITTKILNGDVIQTNVNASTGVKIGSFGIRAYTNDANKTETVNINSADGLVTLKGGILTDGTITGAKIQTESAANRGVKIESDGLTAYNTSGTATVKIKSDGSQHEFAGKVIITGTGSNIPATAVSGELGTGNIPALPSSKITNLDVNLSNLDAAAQAAMVASAYSKNPSFDDWTGTWPVSFSQWNSAPTRDTNNKRVGAHGARFNVASSSTQYGLVLDTAISHMPNVEYVTVEVEFMLNLGSLNGAGVLIDWKGLSPNRATLSLKDEVTNPELGKWYRVTKVLRRPSPTTGTWTHTGGFLMANYSVLTNAAKDITFDWLNIRPSTVQEIEALNASAKVETWSHATNKTTIDGGKIFTNSITATQIDAYAISAKHFITGATVRTSALANVGLKMDDAGLRAYDGATETFNLSALTGKVTATGSFSTSVVEAGVTLGAALEAKEGTSGVQMTRNGEVIGRLRAGINGSWATVNLEAKSSGLVNPSLQIDGAPGDQSLMLHAGTDSSGNKSGSFASAPNRAVMHLPSVAGGPSYTREPGIWGYKDEVRVIVPDGNMRIIKANGGEELGVVSATSEWITANLTYGWANYGSGYGPVRYRKEGTTVRLAGVVNGVGATTSMFTLPTGLRPRYPQMIEGTAWHSGSGDTSRWRFKIDTDGMVTQAGYSPGTVGSSAWLSFDGITFAID